MVSRASLIANHPNVVTIIDRTARPPKEINRVKPLLNYDFTAIGDQEHCELEPSVRFVNSSVSIVRHRQPSFYPRSLMA
jgi:hypothetical protein